MEFLRSNLYEIKKAGSLKTLGGLLALFHLLQFYVWWHDGNLPLKLVQQPTPMCWSLFETCGWLRYLPLGVLAFIYYAYAALMVIAALSLLLTDLVAIGYYLLVIGSVLGFFLYVQDMRLSSNDGYFIFFSTTAFLLVPSKHRLMRFLFASFFVARGLAQASPDWLTGNWFMEHMKLPVKLAEWFAALSLLVQMIGGATLLLRDGRYFWTGWIALFTFECGQLFVGELLQASLGMGALVFVAFDELELRKAEREYLYQSFIRPEPSFLWGAVLLAFFWVAQLVPLAGLGHASALKSALDIWALHPEAAHEECDQRSFAIYKHRTVEIDVRARATRQAALQCNAYMRFLDLRAECESRAADDPEFLTIGSTMIVHGYRDKSTYRAFESSDVCAADLTFKRLKEVEWNTSPAR